MVLVLGLGIALPLGIAAWTRVARDWKACGEASDWKARGDKAFEAADYATAVRAYARARSADPSRKDVARLFARARVLDTAWHPETLQGADLADVLMDVEGVEAAFPGDKPTTTALRGFVAAASGRIEEGEALYRKAIEADAGNGPAHLGLALLLRRDPMNAKAAVTEMEAVVKARPKSAEHLALLGRFQLDVGDAKGAAENLRQAVGIRQNAEWLRDLGQALMSQGDAAAAGKHLTDSLKLDSRDALTHQLMAQALIGLKQPAQAEAAARSSLALKQTSSAAFLLAQALNAQQKFGEAVQLLQQLLQTERDLMMLVELAKALDGMGRVADAVSVYRQIVSAQLPKEQMQSRFFQDIVANAQQRLQALQSAVPAAMPGKGGAR